MQCPSVWVCPILFLMVRLELWGWGRKTTGVKGPSHHTTFGNGAHPHALPVRGPSSLGSGPVCQVFPL